MPRDVAVSHCRSKSTGTTPRRCRCGDCCHVPPSSVLPAAPSALRTAPGRSVRRRKARSSSNLGEIRSDQSGAVLLAPLPRERKCAIEGGGKAGAAGFGRPCRAQPRPENHAAGTRRHRSESAHAHCPLPARHPAKHGNYFAACACFGIEAHIIEPAGFPTTDRAFRRAGMDYLDAVTIVRHRRWRDFEAWRQETRGRLVLFTTRGDAFLSRSALPAGRHAAVRARIGRRAGRGPCRSRRAFVIPMRSGLRSLNVAVAAAMAAGEALRQTGGNAADRGYAVDHARLARLSTAKVCNVEMSALGSAASETTRMRTCICLRSRSTQHSRAGGFRRNARADCRATPARSCRRAARRTRSRCRRIPSPPPATRDRRNRAAGRWRRTNGCRRRPRPGWTPSCRGCA